MNLLRLSWKNIWSRPLASVLSLILFALGIGLITVLMLVNAQLKDQFENNLAGIDLVIGAKGSPMQLILCNMYHIDAPTGNISIGEVKPFLNPKHPLIETSVPVSVGDNYKTYRIIGTTHTFADLYDAQLAQGNWWHADYQVTVGAQVAKALHLHIGDTFLSSHGFDDNEDLVHDHHSPFLVVGIFEPTGSVLDQLILTSTSSVWAVHGNHDHEDHPSDSTDHADLHDHDSHEHGEHGHDTQDGHDHAGHDHSAHDHRQVAPSDQYRGQVMAEQLLTSPEEDITALLIRYKNNNHLTLSLPRSINENTDLQAANPAYEINRVYAMMGTGTEALRALAILIAIVSGLSVFFSLLSSLKDRKYELSLLRVMGAGRGTLFLLIIMEGLLLALLGYVLGFILAHVGAGIFAGMIAEEYQYSIDALRVLPTEIWVALSALLIGVFASLLPAWQAYRTDIHETLSQG